MTDFPVNPLEAQIPLALDHPLIQYFDHQIECKMIELECRVKEELGTASSRLKREIGDVRKYVPHDGMFTTMQHSIDIVKKLSNEISTLVVERWKYLGED